MTDNLLSLDWKTIFRKRARAARAAAHADPRNAHAAEAASARARMFLDLKGAKAIALYVPLGSELDTAPLAGALMLEGHSLLLPVVKAKDEALEFRLWELDVPLARGAHGTAIPPEGATTARPDILIVPLLGVRPDGARLGMGGGYYDRTLGALREEGDILAVGYGYDAQVMDRFPVEPHDAFLDAFVSDRRTLSFTGGRPAELSVDR